jgi:Na+/H+ antiporter NhaD/arsenite permease-like protein
MENTILENSTSLLPAWIALGTFIVAYILVILEEFIQLRKSKPMVLGAGIIWAMVALIANQKGLSNIAGAAIRHNLMDYAEILLFIIVAMTYINTLTERRVFEALRTWLIHHRYTYRKLFWITGILSFFLSAIADNLTTALAMSAVIMAVGKGNPRFIALSCINLVVAANAGGAFSPFGDITTLMVWQAGLVPFSKFFKLFLPSVINFIIPALCMHFALPKGRPTATYEKVTLSRGGKRAILLFILTIVTTVLFQSYFHLPPAIGMMMGLAYLQFFAYYTQYRKQIRTLEIFPAIKELDWDTLLFFYGVILAVGGLATLGYLEIVSSALYGDWITYLSPAYHHTPGNIIIGILSALVDNIPLMFAAIKIHPIMSLGQWLLITLTAGVGGSLLSIGSAAGVGVMGQAHGFYSFFSHLKWIWAIALGYVGSIAFHLWWNADLF